MVKFNEVIRIKREALMLTQEQFAQKMGLTGSVISSFENGKDISEASIKLIKFTIKDLEQKLTDYVKQQRQRHSCVCIATKM